MIAAYSASLTALTTDYECPWSSDYSARQGFGGRSRGRTRLRRYTRRMSSVVEVGRLASRPSVIQTSRTVQDEVVGKTSRIERTSYIPRCYTCSSL